ncbi:GDSL esterase/lipase [Canna indica]|uniref:GDSL esterase/lipase n=1 Tax=Canna indica TaxID=4628 RepID=A0AAQ3JXK5_9LILI|nr:GDSL esterase/lipase [Canna indica]
MSERRVNGDSNSDTGGLAAGLGYPFPQQEGHTFFHHSSGRLCDGRLVIDLLLYTLSLVHVTCVKGPIDAEGFQNALCAIDIGQNDLSAVFYENSSYAQVIERIQSVIHEIRKAIEASVYTQGC